MTTNILLRAIPDADVVQIAVNAARAGLSRSEYLRRLIHEEMERTRVSLAAQAGTCSGLFPPDILPTLDTEWAQ